MLDAVLIFKINAHGSAQEKIHDLLPQTDSKDRFSRLFKGPEKLFVKLHSCRLAHTLQTVL